jgi:serine/threonine-protein kinase
MLGQMLGKNYRVLERLGEGGMGQVYVVEHVGLRKRFAAKVLSVTMATHPEARARFEMEAHAASKLEHDNIVNVTDLGFTNDGRPYLVMELLKGLTLHDRMAQGPISLEEAVAIIVPVCEALSAAHAAGIVHRDVKPENIFVVTRPGGRFVVKVLDFGISKFKVDNTRLTQIGQVLGSPTYMAPEMCRGEEVDHRADVYSSGVVLYHMLCGRPPFVEDGNLLKLMQSHVSAKVPLPRSLRPDLPEAIEAVIMGTLAKDPERRTPSVEALADELLAALPAGADRMLFGPLRTPTGSQSRLPSSPSHDRLALAGPSTAPTVPSGELPAVATPLPPPRRWTVPVMLAVGIVVGILALWWLGRSDTPSPLRLAPVAVPVAPVTPPVVVTPPLPPPVVVTPLPPPPVVVTPPLPPPVVVAPVKPTRPLKPSRPARLIRPAPPEPTKPPPPPPQLEIRKTR